MPRQKSKPTDTDWVEALKESRVKRSTVFPENAKTFDDIVALLAARKMPHGQNQVRNWIKESVRTGKLKTIEGMVFSEHSKRMVRCVRYQLQ